ncbi:ketopantoate reductase family protein [Mycetocola zhujimingii]|uniref:Ketopantoate reductase family protein n=1 Tax=Mycetocola zhujimingii TaxID=2079792 RepID=A0A2U1TEP1_9MICO|nr:ketopantoate reductase family protein [Mycetocola zhujimingii]AWB85948.1 2-dehydropantoate 2-reductase [Mycetocola zhujimingii]PWC07280.1 ketopantoate reductase family protein [Mycetocola zhujimingii]
MRVAVIGAGALGCTFAALLDRAGHDVTLVARGAQLEAVSASGIHLNGGFGDWQTTKLVAVPRLETPPTPGGDFDLVFLAVKAQDTATAIAEHGGAIDGTPVIVVQNGLDGVDTVSKSLVDSSCVGALSIVAASYLEPGSVRVTTPATTYIGRGTGDPDAEVRRIEAELGDALRLTAIGNFVGAQWTKLLVNQLNALPAITGLSVQEVVADRTLRLIMTRSMRETVRVGAATGIRFGSIQGLGNLRLRFFARLPVVLGQALPARFASRMGPVPNPGSTLQSIRRGQRTEIDFLNGAVVRQARLVGRRAPVNETLTALVHEVEKTGVFFTPRQVADAVAGAEAGTSAGSSAGSLR